MHTFTKQSAETFPITIDFINLLQTSETISSITAIGYDSANTVVTSTIINSQSIEGTKAKVVVKSGTHRSQYKITVRATTSLGNVYEEDVTMKVQDK